MNQIKIILIISFLLIGSLLMGTFIFNRESIFKDKHNISTNFPDKEVTKKISDKIDLRSCLEGWERYGNDILGLGFCYKKDWGEPILSPVENLTLLDGVADKYLKDSDGEVQPLIMGFKALDSKLEIKIFNDNYGGEYYPNLNAREVGFMDNIGDLKISQNICDYKINFTEMWQEQGRMTEFWSDCHKGIKTRIINQEKYSDRALYIYNLESLAYLKLQNNFFDNALIKKKYIRTGQIIEKIENFSQLFDKKNYPNDVSDFSVFSQDDYQREKEEFGIFANSMYSYIPPKKERLEFNIVDDEDNKITKIRKYYWLLNNQNLEEAYTFYDKNNLSLEQFEVLYKNIYSVTPRDFKKVNDSTYQFFLNFQEQNNSEKIYRITIKIDSADKLKVISEEEITSEMIKFGNYTAYSKKQNGKNFVVLESYGIENILAEGASDYNENHSNIADVIFFREIEFSPKGDYLIYKTVGWEWMSARVYDINQGEQVFYFDYPHIFNFTDDEKNFFVCTNAGIGSGTSGSIYSVPDFKKQFELFNSEKNNSMKVECNYNKEKNELSFSYDENCSGGDIKGDGLCAKREVIYSFGESNMISNLRFSGEVPK